MILEVVKYGHPVLRKNGAEITEITPEIQTLIDDMFETMDDYHGIGLAAQQVAQAAIDRYRHQRRRGSPILT